MKMKKRRFPKFAILGFAALALAVAGCSSGNGNEEGQSASTSEEKKNSIVKEGMKPTLDQQILIDYLDMKDALVKGDAEATRTLAETMVTNLKKVPESTHGTAAELAHHIAQEGDINSQRELFHKLSDVMYGIIKTDNPAEATVYKQYCPMAFQNTGAFWLSAEKEIRNPYFGDKMLKCGVVQEEL